MGSPTIKVAMAHVRDDDVDDYVPLETLANLAGAVRRASERRVGQAHADAVVLAVGLAAELAREAAALRGQVPDLEELEQRVHDVAARVRQSSSSAGWPTSGPGFYLRLQEKVEDVIRGYARGLRQGHGEISSGALNALEAEGIGIAGELADVLDTELAGGI